MKPMMMTTTAIGRSWNHLMPELTPNQIKLVVQNKKKN
jgi:hypothetical protein